MHYNHQPYKQIWAHPLLNGHLLGQLGEGEPHLKPNTIRILGFSNGLSLLINFS
jgi:hypothetical protein